MGKIFAHLFCYFALAGEAETHIININSMNTEEKIEQGQAIYAEYRRKYFSGDFYCEAERHYVSAIIEACEMNFYDRLIPLREMCLALEYCHRAGRAVSIVLDAPYLSGGALEAYRRRYAGNKMRLLGAGRKADAQMGRSYHIEYVDRPFEFMSLSTRALLSH